MRRTIYPILFVALALLAGCARESMENLSPEANTILAFIDGDEPETRTVTIDNPGVRISTYWQAGDRIGIIGKSGSPAEFSVASNDISADGKSANFRSTTSVPSGSLLAFYPWQEGSTASGNLLNINFPASQKYTTLNSIVQPDAGSSIMVASGSASNGLPFRNVMAMLKIGQAFDEEVTITKVEFRDLSGKAVCGPMTVDLDNNYSSEISGNGTVLTLDCGDGVLLRKNELGKFFLIVPARDYPKGFEVTFYTSKGESFTRQAGTMGKKLERGIVYPVGDVSSREYVAEGVKTEFMPGVTLLSGGNLDKVKVLNKEMWEPGWGLAPMPIYDMMVHKDLKPVEGGMFVLEANDDLPSGGVYEIQQVESYGANYSRVRLVPADNPASAYKNLDFGGDIWDEEGNLLENNGLDFDLANYLSGITDSEGNPIPFSVSRSTGEILFSEEATEQLLGIETKGLAKTDKSISTPTISKQIGGDNCNLTLGASMTLTMKAAVRIQEGEIQFIHFTVHPVLQLSAKFLLKKEWSESWSKDLITLYFVPGVPIAPGLVMEPKVNFSAGLSVGASIKFSADLTYTYDCGNFGCSYNAGDGFHFRHQEPEQPAAQVAPELDYNLDASLYASVNLGINPALHIWGLMEVGIDTDLSLSFGLYGDMKDGIKLALTPGLKFTPRTAALGGWLTKKWDVLSFSPEFDPIWEGYLFPKGTRGLWKKLKTENVCYTELKTNPDGSKLIKCCSIPSFRLAQVLQIPTDVGFSWVADYETENLLLDWDLYLYIFNGTGLNIYVSPTYLTFNEFMKEVGYYFTDYSGRFIEIQALRDTGDRETDDILAVLKDARVSRKIKLCHLGAGEKNEKRSDTIWPGFAPGQAYGYALAWVHGDYEFIMEPQRGPQGWFRYVPDPHYPGDDRSIKLVETTDGNFIPNAGLYGFRLWWPDTPLGKPWWETKTIGANDQYWWAN